MGQEGLLRCVDLAVDSRSKDHPLVALCACERADRYRQLGEMHCCETLFGCGDVNRFGSRVRLRVRQ